MYFAANYFPCAQAAAGSLVTHRSTKSQRYVNMTKILRFMMGAFYCAQASAAARRSAFFPRPGLRQAPSAAAVESETTALAWCGLYAAVLSSCFATARKSPGAGYPQRSRRLLQPPHHTPQHKITASRKYAPRFMPRGILLRPCIGCRTPQHIFPALRLR